jgi:adenylate cyclase
MESANADLPADRGIRLRIGINLGDVIVEGSDLYGDGVNIAARLEALADPGSVIVSRTVFNHVRGKVTLGFDDLGEQQLKNIAEPVRIYRLQPHGDAATTRRP